MKIDFDEPTKEFPPLRCSICGALVDELRKEEHINFHKYIESVVDTLELLLIDLDLNLIEK